jgi:glycerophosphoryl diester phosphodiesterase
MVMIRIGHRGAAGTHPENTLVSFTRAAQLGAQGIEFDVHRTSDGHLVVIHDALLDRTTTGTGIIRELSLAAVKAADAGGKKGAQFVGEQVPTLLEVFHQAPSSVHLFLELKSGSLHYPGIEQELLNLIAREGVRERVSVSSFDHQALRRLRDADATIPLGMLYSENLLDAVGMAQAIGANALHPAWEWVTPELVAQAHAARLEVFTWTVNHPAAIAYMQHCGVDGIMSDFPDRLLQPS